MRVLGIETATDVCAAAVVENGRVLIEERLERRHAHSEILLEQIDRVLKETGSRLDKLAGIAVSIGPGSFTGLRIGLSVAKGLSWATGTPLTAVSTLRALARRAVELNKVANGALVLPLIDARRGEVYTTLFELRDAGLEALWDERATAVSNLLDEIGEREVIVAGASSALRELVRQRESSHILVADNVSCCATTVALQGEDQLRHGNTVAADVIEPRYVMGFKTKAGVVN